MDGVIADLKHAVRLLRRNPGFAAVVVATLAIAIGSTVAVFSAVDAWLFRPLNFPHAERLVVAFGARPERPTEPQVWMPYRAYLGWKERSRSFESLSAAFVREALVTRDNEGHGLLGLNVTPEFFQTLGASALLGRTLTAEDSTGPPVVVISYGMWQRWCGGSAAAIGTAIALSGVAHEIVGVMPRDFDVRVLDMTFEFWTPFTRGDAAYGPGGVGPVVLLGRLRPDVTIEAARSEVAAIHRQMEAEYRFNFDAFVVALTSLQGDNTRSVRSTLLTVLTAVGCLLLIAAMNVGALVLGRGLGRLPEVAIRSALGSGRGRLVRQFATETILLVTLGGVFGIGVGWLAVRLFILWNPLGALPANTIRLDLRSMTVAGAALALTAVVSAVIPALRMSRWQPGELLRTGGARASASLPAQRTQTGLLVAQMAMCVLLLFATTLLTRTFVRLRAEPLGFDADRLLIASIDLPKAFDSSERRNLFYQQLAERVRALAGVRAVAAGTSPPLNNGGPTTVNTGPEDASDALRISTQDVTPEFFATLSIPLVAGRVFDDRDAHDATPVVILNARAARDLFGGAAAAVGRRIRLDREGWREVIGVVGGVRSTFFNTLEWRSDPIVYRPAAQAFASSTNPAAASFGIQLHIRADRPVSLGEIKAAVRGADAGAVVSGVRPVSDLIAAATRQPALRATLVASFAAASLFLGAIGVYGLVAQAVRQRLRELAIRLALGARRPQMMALVARRAFAITAAGLLVGAVLSYSLGHALRAVVYGVQPRDAMSLLASAIVLLATTGVAALWPAARVARVDPLETLRDE